VSCSSAVSDGARRHWSFRHGPRETQTALLPEIATVIDTSVAADSEPADFEALPNGTAVVPELFLAAGSGYAHFEVLPTDTAAVPDTSLVAGSARAHFEALSTDTASVPDNSAAATCSGFSVPQRVPHIDL
jgi:hypothetical protein